MRLTSACILLITLILYGANTKTTQKFGNDVNRQTWSEARYELYTYHNALVDDIDTAMAHLTGLYADTAYKAAIKAARLRGDAIYGTAIGAGVTAIGSGIALDVTGLTRMYGAVRSKITKVVASYTALVTDRMIVITPPAESLSLACKVTLPAIGTNHGWELIVKNTCSTGDSLVVIVPNGSEKLDALSFDTLSQWETIRLIADTIGTDTWHKW